MGSLDEFSLRYRLLLKTFPWHRNKSVPWTPLKKPLNNCRLVLISTAGFVAPGQSPFDKSIRGGDTSVREIPADIDVSVLREKHRSDVFDHTGIRQDPNLAFPVDRMRELVAEGRIGSLNHRHFSLMGSITAPGRLLKKTIPMVVTNLIKDGVDIAFLTPV